MQVSKFCVTLQNRNRGFRNGGCYFKLRNMRFFDRKEEIATLRNIREKARVNAQFTVLAGRRRIGKTSLVLHAYSDEPIVYFFVGRKAENLLCDEFRQEVEAKLGVQLGGVPKNFAELFSYLMNLSAERSFTLFIDEFQNFARVNPSVFSDMQRIWDLNHDASLINLIVCGSMYSMMTSIFRDRKEPLYNRQNRFMTIRAFRPSVLKEILAEYSHGHTNEDLLALYSVTGGVAKYVQLLVDDGALTADAIIDAVVSPDSIFISEGRSVLVEEFGKHYDTYFSILSAIASGKTRRNEIESVIGRQVGGHLSRLEDDYGIIAREMPVYAKPLSKNAVYTIRDNFFTFWFRFIFKYAHILEIGGYSQLRQIIERDYATFSGLMLERYFRAKAAEQQTFTRIGRWWDRKGENEIDIVAENEIDRTLLVCEVKRRRQNINMKTLEAKASRMLDTQPQLRGYALTCRPLSLADM